MGFIQVGESIEGERLHEASVADDCWVEVSRNLSVHDCFAAWQSLLMQYGGVMRCRYMSVLEDLFAVLLAIANPISFKVIVECGGFEASRYVISPETLVGSLQQ